jgi:hypothetical protein
VGEEEEEEGTPVQDPSLVFLHSELERKNNWRGLMPNLAWGTTTRVDAVKKVLWMVPPWVGTNPHIFVYNYNLIKDSIRFVSVRFVSKRPGILLVGWGVRGEQG